jgi:hypothetical protein
VDGIGKIGPAKELQAKEDSMVVGIFHYNRFSKLLLDGKPKNMMTKRKKDILLRLEDMVYNRGEVYLVFGITHCWGLDSLPMIIMLYLNIKVLLDILSSIQKMVIWPSSIRSVIQMIIGSVCSLLSRTFQGP